MLKRISFLVLLTIVAGGQRATAQDVKPLATADEVLNAYYEASGGLAALRAVQTVKQTGTLQTMGMMLPAVIYNKRPDFIRMEFSANGMTMIQAYDGRTAWHVNPFAGVTQPADMPEAEASDLREQHIDGHLIDYREKGHSVELSGVEQTEGKQLYRLKVTTKEGKVVDYLMDAETFFPVQMHRSVQQGGVTYDMVTTLADYREVHGLKMPFQIDVTRSGTPVLRLTFNQIDVNAPVDDSIFGKPAN